MNKKWPLLILMIITAMLLLTACKAPEVEGPTDELEAVVTPAPTAQVTNKPWEPDPTITPRPMGDDVITPEPGTNPIRIHPIDRPPINFEPYKYEEKLGAGFEVPASWEYSVESTETTAIYNEIYSQCGEPVGSTIQITIETLGSAQTLDQARSKIDEIVETLRGNFSNVSVSSKAEQNMLKVKGAYVSYWFDVMVDGQSEPILMRGRIHVVPADKKLVIVRYACPADYNSDYVEVYKHVRETLKLL